MALSLGVPRGARIEVEGPALHRMLKVIDIPHTLRALVHNGQSVHDVTDNQRIEILPEVFISIGKADSQRSLVHPGYVRLVFEAPRAVKITYLR